MRATAAIALMLVASIADAAELCAVGCSVSLDFANGGAITAPDGGATITFSSNGSVVLGTGGSITTGTGGSVTPAPAPGADPDMSSGGTILLGSGGRIQFGAGGRLATGGSGGITVELPGSLQVTGFDGVTIVAALDVFIGDVATAGDVSYTADGAIIQDDAAVPIDFSSSTVGADVFVSTGSDLHYGHVAGASVTLTPGQTPGDEETPTGACSYVQGQQACSTSATQTTYLGTGSAYSGPGGGSPEPLTLLLLGALALARRARNPNR